MSLYYEQSSALFPDPKLLDPKQLIEVNPQHPFVIAAANLDWQGLFEQLEPILYIGVNKNLGRKLDLRAHSAAFILQASHNWTDRFTEEMLRYYAPARVFAGYAADTTKSIDHTKIETFRNRLGEPGAQIINRYLLDTARTGGFTNGKTLDTDTTVQESGISHPSDFNLMKKMRQRISHIAKQLFGSASIRIGNLADLQKQAKVLERAYQFFSSGKDSKEKKRKLLTGLEDLTQNFVDQVVTFSKLPGTMLKKLRPYLRKEMEHLSQIGPVLLDQIRHWLQTGKVAANKILSLYKSIPKFISKGKLGKASEVGRKIIVNQYVGGFLSVVAPENPVIADVNTLMPAIRESVAIFGELPNSIAADRGMHSKKNIRLIEKLHIEKNGIQPKGQAPWQVDPETARKLYCRRAAIEPRIGLAGRLGLKHSRAKTDEGDAIWAQRSVIGFNFKKLTSCWSN